MAVTYTIRDGILDRTIGDDLLVHRFDTDEVFVLNGDAKLIFEALKYSSAPDDVCAFVTSRVFGDTVELHHAVETGLHQLLAEGLILAGG
jgi:hypothetical protein